MKPQPELTLEECLALDQYWMSEARELAELQREWGVTDKLHNVQRHLDRSKEWAEFWKCNPKFQD